MRKERPPQKKEDIPAWFMTYSDVITLLMTFFILLLTFASDEPEMYDRMRNTMFGGAGAPGMAGEPADGPERDSFALRIRPSLARMVMRGSEMPIIRDNPDSEPMGLGLEGLEGEEQYDPTTARAVDVPLLLLVTRGGDMTSAGKQQLGMLARQLHHMDLHVTLQVAGEEQMSPLMVIAQYLVQHGRVPGGKIATGLASIKPDYVRIILVRHMED